MSAGDAMRVMSFNIRNCDAADGANCWDNRKSLLVETIRRIDPDLAGLQECLAPQIDFLHEQLSDYEMVGVCRDDGARAGEACSLLYRRDRFDHLDSGTFWLSQRPDDVGSRGWDAELPRVCTWAKLRDRQSSRELMMLNTHFDHRGRGARIESARQLRMWIAEHARNTPTIFTGDFNDTDESIAYRILTAAGMRDCFRAVHPSPIAEEGTFHGFTGVRTRERIDWVLCSDHFDVIDCAVDAYHAGGRYASDHFPLQAELRFSP